MKMRENRPTIEDSLSTTLEVENREHLVRLIVERLGRTGAAVTESMIHISHYGFDDRIDWDEHIIVVDGHGVFGFTNEACPRVEIKGDSNKQSAQQIFGDEVSRAYGVVDGNLSRRV
ncbi:hypothetical protein [Rhodoblastus sp.]|uniref:hypothetical protein n=1 Tax=Rhodoblastus sp. TaxID=1962975 RepID=UPI0025DAE3AC|nr:hypothetical protein [Rhodoblastus sp.]